MSQPLIPSGAPPPPASGTTGRAGPTAPAALPVPTAPAGPSQGQPQIKDLYGKLAAQAPLAAAPSGFAPRLSKAVSLGEFSGVQLSVAVNGRLALPGDSGTIQDTLKAHRLALSLAGQRNPFASLTDTAALATVASRLSTLHGNGLAPPRAEQEVLDLRQLRAGSLALLELSAVRAGELGDPALQKHLLGQLTEAIRKEPFRPLRDFSYDSLDSRAAGGKLPRVPAAEEAIYPSKPPYKQWLADGKLKIAYYIDNNGSALASQLWFMQSLARSLGLTEKKIDDFHYLFTREARDGKPAIEIAFKSPRTREDQPALLEKIDDPSVDVIAYTGHAGYGHLVDHAIGRGAKGTGEGKLVVLLQCSGDGNVESFERAFPDAQVVSSTERTADSSDQLMFRKLLAGVLAEKDWDAIRNEVAEELKQAAPSRQTDPSYKLDPKKHYFFPNSRSVLREKYDRDRDGVPDSGDRVFNVVYPKRLDPSGGFDPVAQVIPDDALDGSALVGATTILRQLMRDDRLLSEDRSAKVRWSAEAPQPAGFFTPAEGDPRAFRFTLDPAAGKLRVALSTRFAHTRQKDLARMLAYEAGLFLGKEAGLDGKGQTALALGMLERAVFQQEGWYGGELLLEEPGVAEQLLLRRYGLEGLSFADISGAIGPLGREEHLRPRHLDQLTRFVASRPALSSASSRAPASVGKALKVPPGLRLGSTDLDEVAITRVLTALGVPEKLEGFGPKVLVAGQPNNLVAVVRDRAGKTRLVGLSLDSEGQVQLASQFDLSVVSVKERSSGRYLAEVAKATGLKAETLSGAFTQKRKAGTSAAEAVAQVLAEQRRSVPLGTKLPGLKTFDTLHRYGLATPGEQGAISEALARNYPTGAALEAEKAVLQWVNAVAVGESARLRKLYLEALVTDGPRVDAGRSITAVLEALPRPLPAHPAFPLDEVLHSGLVGPAARGRVGRVYLDRSGLSPSPVVRDLALKSAARMGGDSLREIARALDSPAAKNPSPREILFRYVEGAPAMPDVDLAMLVEMGVLTAADARAVEARLQEVRRAAEIRAQELLRSTSPLDEVLQRGLAGPAALGHFERSGLSPSAVVRALLLRSAARLGAEAVLLLARRLDAPVARNASSRELLLMYVERFLEPDFDPAMLEKVGILSAADVQAVKARVQQVQRAAERRGQELQRSTSAEP